MLQLAARCRIGDACTVASEPIRRGSLPECVGAAWVQLDVRPEAGSVAELARGLGFAAKADNRPSRKQRFAYSVWSVGFRDEKVRWQWAVPKCYVLRRDPACHNGGQITSVCRNLAFATLRLALRCWLCSALLQLL